jgi:hypothetical protein
MKHVSYSRRGGRVALAALLMSLPRPALAPTIMVDNAHCTLVDAVTAANTDAATGGCSAGSGADTIILNADVTLTSPDSHAYSRDNGLPLVESEITLLGRDFAIERDPDAPPFRLLAVASNGSLTVDDVTLRGGDGAIFNRGVTTLTNSTLTDNTWFAAENENGDLTLSHCDVSDNLGTGMFSFSGVLSVTNSTVSGNAGGGISAYGWGVTYVTNVKVLNNGSVGVSIGDGIGHLTNSTVSGNDGRGLSLSHYFGGSRVEGCTVSGNSGTGIWMYQYYDDTFVWNTTVSGNLGTGIVMVLYDYAGSCRNCTITGNGGGGVVSTWYGYPTVSRSIIADNAGDNCSAVSTPISGVHNFDDDGTCPGSAPISGLDPDLADNGGLTATHALLPGSAAIDAIDGCGLSTDQRGEPRNDDACDAGAYEFQCSITVTRNATDTLIWFNPGTGAFDLVTGLLSDLRGDGDYSRATCMGRFSESPAADPLPAPTPGDGHYYLARGLRNCLGAHYGDSSLTPDPRDALESGPCP